MIGLFLFLRFRSICVNELLKRINTDQALIRTAEHPLDLFGIVRVLVVMRTNRAKDGGEIGSSRRIDEQSVTRHDRLEPLG